MRRRRHEPRHDSAPTVFLHIGTPKSGTTYLQTRMAENHQRAKQQGLLWPGPRWGTHVEAVKDLRQLKPGERPDPQGPWMRLAKTAREYSGPRVLISMEWLTGIRPEQVAVAVASLEPVRVEVILTARDLLRSFVAQWQEMTKNLRPWSWGQFLEEVLEDRGGPARERFWNQQDLPVILRKWAEVVPWERMHLVTVPPQGADPELLWRRFCQVLEIDGASFTPPARDNESLGVVSASLMHRVNVEALGRGIDHDDYQRVFHRRLAQEILAPKRAFEQPIAVSADVDSWIRTRAEVLVDEVRALDVEVVGDLADLLPGEPLEGREPDQVSDSEILNTAVEAMVSLGMGQYELLQQLRADNADLRRQLAELRAAKGR